MTLKNLIAMGIAAWLCWCTAGVVAQEQPAADDEPTLDELLGIGDAPGDTPGDAPGEEPVDPPVQEAGPELNRELEHRLSGQEAAEQFAQAIDQIAEVAVRLGQGHDAGIETQRLQEDIILKLEQIISSAEKAQQESSSSSSSGQPQQARSADRGGQQPAGQPQPGQQPGQQPGAQPGEEPGQQGSQEGEQPGLGEQPGQGRQPNQGQATRGEVRHADLSMQELREGEWGTLPPRLRDELAQSLGESFNPVYRAMTEAYYRRIAELSQQAAEEE